MERQTTDGMLCEWGTRLFYEAPRAAQSRGAADTTLIKNEQLVPGFTQ